MKYILVCLATLLVFGGCNRFGNAEEKKGKERIVCLAKQYNEIIFALGAEQDLVATDLTSTYPPEIKKTADSWLSPCAFYRRYPC